MSHFFLTNILSPSFQQNKQEVELGFWLYGFDRGGPKSKDVNVEVHEEDAKATHDSS